MTKDELETLASMIHNIQYVVPGYITSFTAEFGSCHVVIEWDGYEDNYVVKEINHDE